MSQINAFHISTALDIRFSRAPQNRVLINTVLASGRSRVQFGAARASNQTGTMAINDELGLRVINPCGPGPWRKAREQKTLPNRSEARAVCFPL
jgi:hypothetical protein